MADHDRDFWQGGKPVTDTDKLVLIEDGLVKGLAAMTQMAEALRDVTDCLDDMTRLYVEVRDDHTPFDGNEEIEVIAARKMIVEIRTALLGLPLTV